MKKEKDAFGQFSFSALYAALSEVAKGILLVDEKGNIHKADATAGHLLGYSPATLERMSIFQLDVSLSMIDWRNWWKSLKKKGTAQKEALWRNGRDAPVAIRLSAGWLVNAVVSLAVCHIRRSDSDVLLPLLRSCARYTRCGAWEWDIQRESFTVTDYFYTLFDLDAEEYARGRLTLVELLNNRLTNQQLEELTGALNRLRQGHEYVEMQLHLSWKSTSKVIHFRADPIVEDGQLAKIRGIAWELPAASEDTRRAQLLLDKAKSMICWIRPDGTLAYANESLCDALGYSIPEMLRDLTIHQIDIENPVSQWNSFRTTLEQEPSLLLETSFQRKNGTVFPVEITLIRLDGELTGMVAKDISARRQEEAQLKAGLLQVNQLSRQLEAENLYLQEEIFQNFENIISKSKAYAEVLHQVEQVAPTDSTVLIEGESGTGKELLAHAIYRLSRRNDRTLVKVNCAVLPENLIESELFGHEKGAFTGADKRRIGRFELADSGTIFLDEIGELPLDVQVKLLRVLQEGEFERVGGNVTLTVDVRIIAATNRNLKDMISKGTFREDLYYRLNVFPIENIPLRQRTEDIPLLANHFLKKFSLKTGKHITNIRTQDLKRLQQYPFPGNVRELENIIERAVILSWNETLDLSYWKPGMGSASRSKPAVRTMEKMQYELIVETLRKTNWKVSGPDGAAVLLDMHPQTLYSRMRKLGIRRDQV